MYPGINNWLRDKVIPGLKTGARTAFIAYDDERPIITAVVKRDGHRAKFCHLRVTEAFRDIHLGDVFFALMAMEARRSAREIHFTLPESLWIEKHGFFKSFCFKEALPASTQYRLFDSELSCSASFQDVWSSVLEKLPLIMNHFSINEYSMCPRLLLSIKHEYAQRVLEGKKTVEVRRRVARKWSGERIALYSSRPTGALVGEATIQDVTSDSPKVIWENYGDRIGCSYEEFSQYAGSCHEIFAITLGKVTPYVERIPLAQAESLIQEELVPPQSYYELEAGRPWTKAVSVAALLHGSMRTHRAQGSPAGYFI
jgi:predicted transcriptional regulator